MSIFAPPYLTLAEAVLILRSETVADFTTEWLLQLVQSQEVGMYFRPVDDLIVADDMQEQSFRHLATGREYVLPAEWADIFLANLSKEGAVQIRTLPDGLGMAQFIRSAKTDERVIVSLKIDDVRVALAELQKYVMRRRTERTADNVATAEIIFNGAPIDWDYWLGTLPTLTSAQASRLMCGLDPIVFADLEARPNDNDPSRHCLQAAKLEALALADDISRLTSSAWIDWALEHSVHVSPAFKTGGYVGSNRSQPEDPLDDTDAFIAELAAVSKSESMDDRLKRGERQRLAIAEVAMAKYKNPLKIPSGGKGVLLQSCLENKPKLFASHHQFNAAWKAEIESDSPRFRMDKHSEFGKRY
ncbi:MAG: hypothetical protein Q7T25_16540 [Sideroxyarcus sp.]|nr:hypothetical protein [Sideroxyarcus sp.]